MLYYFKRNYDMILILSGYTRCDSQQVYADQNQTGHKTLGSDEDGSRATTKNNSEPTRDQRTGRTQSYRHQSPDLD